MTTLGLWITGLSGVAIALVGLLYLTRPRWMAATFGLSALPHEEATPWLRLKGIRDLAAGVVAGTLLLTAPSAVIAWVLLAFTLIPLGDAVTVLAARGDPRAAWGIHGMTAAIMLVGVVFLLLGE